MITTNTGGNPELIKDGETGLLFEVKDYAVLAGRLKLLHDSPDLCQKPVEKAASCIQNKFTLQKIITDYENLYK